MTGVKKILIIDDERDYAEILKERLQFKGYEVEIACDGVSGLKKATEWIPDLILLDIMMPEMDGFEAAKLLREADKQARMKIVLVTAFGRELDEAQLEIVGDMPIIRKPFEMSDLMTVIQQELSSN